MTTATPLRVLAALLLVLTLAGCGSGGSSAASTDSGDQTAGSTTVTIDDMQFDPGEVSVAAGTEVTWTNDDDAPHTVTFDDDSVASSDQLETGDSFSTTFDEPGTYAYVCAIHPDMTATVTVT